MCGITGLISKSRLTPLDLASVRQMQTHLAHRGPDGEGAFEDEHYAGAMRRLSIIDVAGSGQPLVSADGRFVLFFNGEIYNYRELRTALEYKGDVFITKGDGETIIHLYRRYGQFFVEHLRGMFALALWDRREKKLILARDRFGEKPLYLFESGSKLLFSSELKSLFASGHIPLALNASAVNQLFHLNFVIDPLTIVEGVSKLPPATVMEVDTNTWQRTERRYWDITQAEPLEGNADDIILDRLHEAVQFNLRSDRPVGIALSGGLDSSAIAAVAARYRRGDLHAISVGYPLTERESGASDERDFARELAALLRIPFHDIEISRDEIVSAFPHHVVAIDDPVVDIASYGYASVARKAQELDIPVLLFGMGGDELFAGYAWMAKAYRSIARELRWTNGRAAPGEFSRIGSCQPARSKYFESWDSWSSRPGRSPFWQFSLDFQRAEERLPAMLTASFRERLAAADPNLDPANFGSIADPGLKPGVLAAKFIAESYLIGNGIPQADRLGMQSSVEARQPLLDHRFVEAVIGSFKSEPSYPPVNKNRWRGILAAELPQSILDRPKKGFRPPAADWFQAIAKAYGERLRAGCLVQQSILSESAIDELVLAKPESRIAMPFYFKAIVLTLWYDGMQAIVHDAQRVAA